MFTRRVSSCLLLLTCSAVAQGWTQVSTAVDPGAVREGAMSGHTVTGDVILFGGWPVLGDTWQYLAGSWTQLSPATAPPARRENAMADDLGRGRVVMFGGLGAAGALGDTWEWDGANWTQLTPAASPAARHGHVMAHDVTRGVTVLFGGTSDANRPVELRDTWEWNGATWTQVVTANAPAESYRSSMCFDAARGVCVLTGGTSLFGAPDQRTWEYDGVNWTDVTATVGPGPSATPGLGVSGAAMAFDLASGVSLLYGGRTPNGTFSTDTFAYDGTAWSIVASGTPSSRTGMMVAVDITRGRLVLYGGATGNLQTSFNETWELASAVAASFAPFGQGCAGSAGVPALAAAAGSLPRSGSSFTLELTGLPAGPGLCYVALGFDDQSWNGLPLPLSLGAFGLPGCQLFCSLDDGVFVSYPAGGVAQWTLSIPTGFDGLVFFDQAASFDPLAGNPSGIAVSNAGRGVIGN